MSNILHLLPRPRTGKKYASPAKVLIFGRENACKTPPGLFDLDPGCYELWPTGPRQPLTMKMIEDTYASLARSGGWYVSIESTYPPGLVEDLRRALAQASRRLYLVPPPSDR